MKTPIEVRLMGPSLLCQSVEALLAIIGPIYGENSSAPGVSESAVNSSDAAAAARRRSGSAGATVVLLVGEGWQNRVAADARGLRRNNGDASVGTPRYALIVEGSKIDFYGARKMAVNAFIGTDEPTSVLVQGIQAAAQNRLYCSPQLLPALIDAVGNGAGEPEAKSATNSGGSAKENAQNSTASQAALLSTREHEVALHAARGLSNEQIAVFLGISIPTVKFHLMHAFRKLDIQRRTQLYAYMPFLTSVTEALLPPVVD